MLALATIDETGVGVIDIQGQAVRRILKGHVSPIVRARFSLDGRKALSQSKDGVICLWNLDNGERIGTLEASEPDKAILIFTFRTDDEQFLTLRKDGTGQIYSTADGTLVTTFTTAFAEDVNASMRRILDKNTTPIAFTTTDILLITVDYIGSNKSKLKILNISQGTIDEKTISSTFPEVGVRNSHSDWAINANRDGSRVVLRGHELFAGMGPVLGITLVNAQTGEHILQSGGLFLIGFSEVHNFSPDGALFVRFDRLSSPAIRVYDAHDGSEIYALPIEGKEHIADVGVSSNREYIFVAQQFYRNKNTILRYVMTPSSAGSIVIRA
ncbi:WD40 repeat domain-containing protein [Acuticoccus mangrovi]|uniref:Anaphase-promoting complex subunit 4 WD40 domain-containing protein n=1 Tax=Acuticoccus mangrovi TaxID=2796142 RepID=A0A934IV27_9HYPH|nr:hypothetical protein [Acuticoccus mangrovi]MBJ3778560.1 hypothetical protein [Acuticoccus mangrovi]